MAIIPIFLYSIFLSLVTLSASQNGGTPGSGGGGKGGVNMELWCVAKNNAEDAALQSALDWACGPGGADCGPIQNGGPCYDPSDIQRTATYAFNDYFLKHGLSEDSCNFDNTAALISLDPSHGNCKIPSSFSVSKGSDTGTMTGTIGTASSEFSNSNSVTNRSPNLGVISIHLVFILPLIL